MSLANLATAWYQTQRAAMLELPPKRRPEWYLPTKNRQKFMGIPDALFDAFSAACKRRGYPKTDIMIELMVQFVVAVDAENEKGLIPWYDPRAKRPKRPRKPGSGGPRKKGAVVAVAAPVTGAAPVSDAYIARMTALASIPDGGL